MYYALPHFLFSPANRSIHEIIHDSIEMPLFALRKQQSLLSNPSLLIKISRVRTRLRRGRDGRATRQGDAAGRCLAAGGRRRGLLMVVPHSRRHAPSLPLGIRVFVSLEYFGYFFLFHISILIFFPLFKPFYIFFCFFSLMISLFLIFHSFKLFPSFSTSIIVKCKLLFLDISLYYFNFLFSFYIFFFKKCIRFIYFSSS